jgi:hypothetical protein
VGQFHHPKDLHLTRILPPHFRQRFLEEQTSIAPVKGLIYTAHANMVRRLNASHKPFGPCPFVKSDGTVCGTSLENKSKYERHLETRGFIPSYVLSPLPVYIILTYG